MTRIRKLGIVAVAVAGAGVVAWVFAYRPEPTDGEKRLSEWVEQFGTHHWNTNQAAAREAEAAIRKIAHDAIPFLLDWMWTEESSMKKQLRDVFPSKWHDGLHLKDTSDEIRTKGAHGIAALGTNVPADVVPKLVEIARKHPNEHGQYLAVFALRTLGPAAQPAIPFFVECLTNKEPTIRDEAAIAFGSIGRPEIAVPVLVKYIEFSRNLPSSYEARDALESLGRIGTNAKPAVPVFLSFLDHPNVDTRRTVTNCLPGVDAEAAAKAGVKRGW